MTTILITSIASLAGLGIVGCLENNRASLRIVGTNSVVKAAGNFLADKAYLVMRVTVGADWMLVSLLLMTGPH